MLFFLSFDLKLGNLSSKEFFRLNDEVFSNYYKLYYVFYLNWKLFHYH